MVPQLWTSFESLSKIPRLTNAFTLRHPGIDVSVGREEALKRLANWHAEVVRELGFSHEVLATARQVHGNTVSIVSGSVAEPFADTDGMICNTSGIMLGIYVADCCAVYLADKVTGAFGVLHSGKKGTEQNITGIAINLMRTEFGTQTENLVVQLSPCIRPPSYEVDFAAIIREQARSTGVPPGNIHDNGICTSSDPTRFYSYRTERGKTGRMLALLGRSA